MALPCPTCGTQRPSADEPCPKCSSLPGDAASPDAETLPLPGKIAGGTGAPDGPTEIADRYQVLDEIGRGGFGTVYRAFDPRLGREVAIKRLSEPVDPGSDLQARFEREARILASLDHPNIVPIFDAGLDDDYPYIAMKLVAGRSLRQVLDEGPLEERDALSLLKQIAAGLAHAHSRGILHRDVKPSNILEEKDGRIFLADFGLSASTFQPRITQRGAMIGTLDYMAPEALSGECTHQSDLYSLGAVLYKMIFGQSCFSADNAKVLFWKICSETPALLLRPPAEVSSAVIDFLKRLLSKDPADRPENIQVVQAEIENLLGSWSSGLTTDSSSRAGSNGQEVTEAIEKLEAHVEEVGELGRREPLSLSRLLAPLTHFIFGASRLIQQLRQADDETHPICHAAALSLLHMSREIERRVGEPQYGDGESDPLQGNLIHLQVRVEAPAAELVRRLESRNEQAGTDDFFAFVEQAGEAPLQETEWIEDLLSTKELRRHEAALTVVGSGLEIFLAELSSRSPAADRDRLLEGLWGHADVLLLEGRGRSRPVFEAAIHLASTPEMRQKWRTLYSLFHRAGDSYWDPVLVGHMVHEQPKEDRRVFARALLIHPLEAYRRIALGMLRPPDFWIAIAHERLPLPWLLEIWRHLRDRVGDDYLKIFFVCLKDRLEQPGEPDRIVATVELVKELFKVDCFHESLFFKLLTDLEGHVRAQARRCGLLADFDSEYVSSIKTFRARQATPDQPVQGWGKVPLPVQRLLARRGHFQKHFACHPIDPIALECLPHLLLAEDIADFLKIHAINTRLLGEIAKEERLFHADHNKLLLVANPKTPPFIVAKHIGFLRLDSLKKLIHSHDCNRFAHDYALRLLAKRQRFRAQPEKPG